MYPSSLAPTTVVVDLDLESSRRFPWFIGAICGRRVSETVGTNLQPRKIVCFFFKGIGITTVAQRMTLLFIFKYEVNFRQ